MVDMRASKDATIPKARCTCGVPVADFFTRIKDIQSSINNAVPLSSGTIEILNVRINGAINDMRSIQRQCNINVLDNEFALKGIQSGLSSIQNPAQQRSTFLDTENIITDIRRKLFLCRQKER